MIRAVAPHMKAQGKGVVVNVASIAGIMAIGSSVAYIASKAALIAVTKALARALGPEIRLNAVCPGFIQGEWLKDGMGQELYEAVKNHLETTLPLRATCTPEKVAQAIFLFMGEADLGHRGNPALRRWSTSGKAYVMNCRGLFKPSLTSNPPLLMKMSFLTISAV